jgi:hypothetical protein
MEIDAVKLNVEWIGLEGGELLKPPVTMQLVEDMAEKSSQAQEQCQRIAEMYVMLAQAVTDVGVRK